MLLSSRTMNYQILEYLDDNGKSPFGKWFNDLDAVIAARVDKYLRRLETGNLGNSKPVGSGVIDLKMDIGPGYRVYYGRAEETVIILLGGGDKKRQAKDIEQAIKRWMTYKMRRE